MYESWHVNQHDQYNDGFHKEFEIFGLESQGSDTSFNQLERIDATDILDWVNGTNNQHLSPGQKERELRLLLTRHKNHQHYEIKTWYMAFEKPVFQAICNLWKLPPDYLFLRKHAGGCGAYQRHTTLNEEGSISHMCLTIRVPHSPRANAKAIWSLAVSWDAESSCTRALFDGASDADIQEVQQYLQAKQQLISHPLLLLTMVLELLSTFFIDHRREQERLLYLLEYQLGITRGMNRPGAWSWNYELHQESTKKCNIIYTSLVYLERRLEFVVGLSHFLLEILTSIDKEELFTEQHRLRLSSQTHIIRETVANNRDFAKMALHQTICLQKRCQSLAVVLSAIIAQQDSKTNVKIARAAKRDSSSMKAVAVLGFTFLPAMLVASMFSMSMFDFSGNSPAGGSSFVTSNFWIYWVVTIPLTIAVFAIWKLWMDRDISGEDSEFLSQSKTMAVPNFDDSGLYLNTPLQRRKQA